jgi:hypothetical protein
MYGVLCDILSKDAASRHIKWCGSQRKWQQNGVYIFFRTPLYMHHFQISFETTDFIIPFPEN